MGVTLVITPIVIASWPMISAAVAGAVASLGLAVKESVKDELAERESECVRAEITLADQNVTQNLSSEQHITVMKGDIKLVVKRDVRGRCVVSAQAKGKTEQELTQVAEEFSQKLTQCFVYNKVMTELRSKGFKVSNEEVLKDKSIRINIRHEVQ